MRERAGGIGELNESSLRARLKALYLEEGAAREAPVGRYVADRLSYCLRAAGVLRVAGRAGRRLRLERTQA